MGYNLSRFSYFLLILAENFPSFPPIPTLPQLPQGWWWKRVWIRTGDRSLFCNNTQCLYSPKDDDYQWKYTLNVVEYPAAPQKKSVGKEIIHYHWDFRSDTKTYFPPPTLRKFFMLLSQAAIWLRNTLTCIIHTTRRIVSLSEYGQHTINHLIYRTSLYKILAHFLYLSWKDDVCRMAT